MKGLVRYDCFVAGLGEDVKLFWTACFEEREIVGSSVSVERSFFGG